MTTLRKLSPKATALLLLAALLVGIAAGVLLNLWQPVLRFSLRGEWIRHVADQPDAQLELTVKGSKMEYRFVSHRFPELNAVLHEYRFFVLDEDRIRIQYDNGHSVDTTVTVQDGVLTFSPAFTVTTDAETWIKIK